jgi:ribosomal protein L37AE/L43A
LPHGDPKAKTRCPECDAASVEIMPTDAGLYFWECPGCRMVVTPRPGVTVG